MSLFRPLTSPSIRIEKAVLETLETWLPTYLAEVERQNNLQNKALLRPPTPESYHGGLDWLSVKQDRCPEVIVICNPTGEPERMASAYMQDFQTEVGCIIFSEEGIDPEGTARRNASLFALAITAALVQQGSLNLSSVEETLLIGAPRVEFHDVDDRRIAVGVSTLHVYAELLEQNAGPKGKTPPEAPGYQGLEEPFKEAPEITKDTITLQAKQTTETV